MDWRRLNRVLHRDVGYLAFGMTLVYVVTGVVLNHIRDINPNYHVNRQTVRVEPFPDPASFGEAEGRSLAARLGEEAPFRGVFRPSPTTAHVFLEGVTIKADLATGEVIAESVRPRTVLGKLNALHLNRAKAGWVWFADLYAVALGLLAVTGLFLLRGKLGITGRGAYLTAAGIVLPLLLAWLVL